MNKIHITLMTVVFALPCFGQIEWVSDFDRPHEIKTFMVSSQNHHVVNLASIETSGSPVPIAIAIDGMGSEVYRLAVVPWENSFFYMISDIVELSDSSILFTNILFSVDDWGWGSFWDAGVRIDKTWEIPEWVGIPFFSVEGAHGLRLSEGYVLYAPDGSRMARVDNDDVTIWNNYADFTIHGLTVTTDDRLVWAGSDGLVVMDADGNIETVYPDLLFEEVQATLNDGIVGLRQDTLFLLSPGFGQVASHGFPSGQVLDYSVAFGKVAVLTENQFIYLFNDSLALQDSFELVDESEFQFVDVGQDWLALAGQETYGTAMPSGGTVANFTKDYSFAGDNYDMSRDVGVTDIQPGEVTGVVTHPGYYEIRYEDVQVTVENFGGSPVDEFYVRFRNLAPNQYSTKKFNNVSLMPGEATTLVWENFKLRTFTQPGGFQDVCLWTSHPDFRLDANSTNDGFCTSFLVNDNEAATGFGFDVYPNPSSSGSTLEYGLPVGSDGKVAVFNNLGVRVAEFETGAESGSLELPKFPAGLYYLALEADGQVVHTLKFVQL